MKNIAIINVVRDRSTGKIAQNLLNQLTDKGYNVTFFYGRGKKSDDSHLIRIDTPLEVYIHVFLSRVTGLQGEFSLYATKRMLRKLKERSVDTIILLNPHAYYLNENALYSYISKNNIRLISIIPDEYAYLGKCGVSPECDCYKTGYGKCPNIHRYPNSWFFDTCSHIMYNKENNYKKLNNAIFVGPGFVIDNLKKSYLGKFMPSAVLDEAIDLDLYRPQDPSQLRQKLGIGERKIIVLCIAPLFKGVEYFKQVATYFKKDERYVFIHIGQDEEELRINNYIHINYVENNSDLSVFYSMADLFLFPSLADTMSNACLESLACGTPLLVFNISGMPYILDETVGTMVEPRDVAALIKVVQNTEKKTTEKISLCRSYAEKRYDIKKYADRIISIANNLK